MRVDWCVSSWFRIKNTHSLTHGHGGRTGSLPARARLGRTIRDTGEREWGAHRDTEGAWAVFFFFASKPGARAASSPIAWVPTTSI